MNQKVSLSLIIALILISLPACTEKDDFIPEPTATSVILTGTVTTSAGKPLAGVPVSVDYREAYWLGPQKILHKAKGVTDSGGHYRLFFEPEEDKSGTDGAPNQNYDLKVDLGTKASNDVILPSDFNENLGNIHTCPIYKMFEKGEKAEINMFFPRRQDLTTELRNYVAEKSVVLENNIRYGAGKETMRREVALDANGSGSVTLPYAIGETNMVTVLARNGYPELSGSRAITPAAGDTAPILFDNGDVLDACRFKLSLYANMAFNGDEYADDRASSTPAPFDFLGFRIVRPDGEYEFPTSRYDYYDSIVWSSPDLPHTLRIHERAENGAGSSEHLTAQWGAGFIRSGRHTTLLTGYKNGRAIYSDTLTFELADRDFLCFDWDRFTHLTQPGTVNVLNTPLNRYNEYSVSATVDGDGNKSVRIYLDIPGGWGKETILNWQQARLGNLLWKHMGHWVEFDESTLGGLFRKLPAGDRPFTLYENTSTRAIIMHRQATEYEEECFYIHAEPKVP